MQHNASHEASSSSPPPPASFYEALERESKRILRCREIEGSLELLVHCDHEIWKRQEPLHRARPALTLTFEGMYEEGIDIADRKLPPALAVLAVVLNHSLRLNNFPWLKVHFWTKLLMSNMLIREDPFEEPYVDDWIWMVQDASFPVFHVDMNRRGMMLEKHTETFYKFFTTKPAHGVDAKYAQEYKALFQNKLLPIGLTTGMGRVTPKCLQRIQNLLDRVFASPARQYTIIQLALNYQTNKAPMLQCVAEMTKKCRHEYKIPSLRLVNNARSLVPSNDDEAEALRQVIAEALDTSSSSSPANGLQKLNFWNTSLGLKHCMALCSALRYGCPVETLQLRKIFKRIDAAEREQCWRWLAFGFFYPRSTRLVSTDTHKLCHVDLPHNPLEPCDVEAFVKTLRDPAGELVCRGGKEASQMQRTSAVEEHKLFVCRVQQGAKFYESPLSGGPYAIFQLACEKELEALCQQGRWTCVVLPGVGFGWVNDDHVIGMEEEIVDASDLRVELTFTNISEGEGPHAALQTLIQHVGHHLSYLNVPNSLVGHSATFVDTIVTHCVNLNHLILVSTLVRDQHVDRLLEALHGDLGGRLLSLDLRENYFGDNVYQKFANFLTNPQRILVLRELRLLKYRAVQDVFSTLHNVLLVNKTLRHLEIMPPDYDVMGDATYHTARDMYERIEKENQGELLPSLSVAQKLAFLSILSPQRTDGDDGHAARGSLDSFMVSSIFKFAAGTSDVGFSGTIRGSNTDKEERALGKIGRRSAVALSQPAFDARNDGALVHFSGLLTTDGDVLDSTGNKLAHARSPFVLDPLFGIAAKGVRLYRDVEMLQWEETSHTSTSSTPEDDDRRSDDVAERDRVYMYDLRWRSEHIDSTSFNDPSYWNPPLDAWVYESKVVKASNVVVGDFKIADPLIDQIKRRDDVHLDAATRKTMVIVLNQRLGDDWKEASALRNVSIEEDKYFYARQNKQPLAESVLGDFRVSFSVTPAYPVTICAQQQERSLAPFPTPAGESIYLLEDGIHSVSELFAAKLETKRHRVHRLPGDASAGGGSTGTSVPEAPEPDPRSEPELRAHVRDHSGLLAAHQVRDV